MRICYQSTTALSDMGSYAQRLRQHAAEVLLPDSSVHVQGINPALYGDLVPGDIYPYPYLKLMIQNAALEACVKAEAQGFDAFVIGSFSEPHLRQSRSAVDIPVVSLPETAFLIACSLAERFALVTLSPSYARRLTEVVARHGMAPRLAGIYTLGEGLDERGASAALDDPRPLLGVLERVAAEAVAAGADLLLPSEGILNEVLYANQVRQVQGAAIMDCVGLALMQAEMFVRARRTMGITYGRAWSYPLAPAALQARMRRNAGLPDLPDAKP